MSQSLGPISFRNRTFMQPMRKLSMHSWGVQFFFSFLQGRGGEGIFCFLPCSQCVPIKFPSVQLPIAPWFYPIWFAQSSIPWYINWKGGCYKWAYLCLFCDLGSKELCLLGKCPMFQIFLWWANQYGPSQKNKIVPECEHTHDLVNTNHTMTSIIMATSTTTLLSVQKMMKKKR